MNQNTTEYTGIDIANADTFDYVNPAILPFDGKSIPFENNRFNGIICTEVLEHVEHYNVLIAEIYRVMAKGGCVSITIPWSARYHYIPYDYFRYTPSALKTMFVSFDKISIKPRGSDISVIANKLIVLWFRNLLPGISWKIIFIPFWFVLLPLLFLIIIIAHFSLWLNLGSKDDPLGYTIICTK